MATKISQILHSVVPGILVSAILFVAGVTASAYTSVSLTLDDSKIYPGTSHEVIVTVPDTYRDDAPACVYVGLDGILCNAPAVIDSLIASGEMPVTVGIFLQPGVIRAADGEVLRYNRSNEFDATNATFGRFLANEVMPAVDGLTLVDGRIIALSDRPDDHMIFGLSSGGIAAFCAAWFHPDLFRRVFSGCGTFVPMRGGNDLQALVRKNEPKPIRVFLQDGFSDTWNPLFGSWFEANAMLGTALEFAGYDCKFDWAEGTHSVRRANEIFPDVMRWIWRDYPEPVVAGRTANNMLDGLLVDDAEWTVAAAQPLGDATPAAVYPDSSLIVYPDDGSNWLIQALWDDTAQTYTRDQRFYWLHSPDNTALVIGGMTFDSNGNLWILTDAGLQICDQNGRVRAIIDLPGGFEASGSDIVIEDGTVHINGFSRRFRVSPPTPGVRPESQGQA